MLLGILGFELLVKLLQITQNEAFLNMHSSISRFHRHIIFFPRHTPTKKQRNVGGEKTLCTLLLLRGGGGGARACCKK